MKKEYFEPKIRLIQVEINHLMTGSELNISVRDEGGSFGGAESKGADFDYYDGDAEEEE